MRPINTDLIVPEGRQNTGVPWTLDQPDFHISRAAGSRMCPTLTCPCAPSTLDLGAGDPAQAVVVRHPYALSAAAWKHASVASLIRRCPLLWTPTHFRYFSLLAVLSVLS